MKIKLITGFRKDQQYSVDSEEAHKAYYLFLNPEKRGVFSNGLALLGADIRRIEPDWHGTMGWNPTHDMDDSDWVEIRSKGVDKKVNAMLEKGKSAAYELAAHPELLALPLSQVELTQNVLTAGVTLLADKFKVKQ